MNLYLSPSMIIFLTVVCVVIASLFVSVVATILALLRWKQFGKELYAFVINVLIPALGDALGDLAELGVKHNYSQAERIRVLESYKTALAERDRWEFASKVLSLIEHIFAPRMLGRL